MKKFLISLCILMVIGGSVSAAMTTIAARAVVPTYVLKVTTANQALLSTTNKKSGRISGMVVSATDASVLTLSDNATTPNTLAVLRIPADETVSVVFEPAIAGSIPTTIASTATFLLSQDVTTTVNITVLGWTE